MPAVPSTVVNPQIVDSISTTHVTNMGEAPAVAMGMFFQMEAQAFSMGLQNAVASQRGMQQLGEAVIATACAQILKTLNPEGGK